MRIDLRGRKAHGDVMKTLLVPLLLALTGCSAATRATRSDGLEIVTITFDSTNAHLVVQNGNAVLVDSGYETNAAKLEAEVRRAGVDPATQLKAVIVTHGHADHAGGARHFQQQLHVPVFVGQGDETMFATGKNEPLCPVGFIAKTRHQQDEGATYTGATADTLVEDVVDLRASTGVDAKVLRLAGHTRGSLIVTAGDVALVGDLFRGSIVGSGAETHFFMCDVDDNRRTVARVLTELAPNAKVYFVGHFGPVSAEAVRAHFVP